MSTVVSKTAINRPVFKGLKDGLTLFIPEEEPLSYWLDVLKSQLEQAKEFFQGALITIDLGNRRLSATDKEGLKQVLSSFNIIIKGFTPERKKNPGCTRHFGRTKDLESKTILINGTVRNGQRVEFDGNIVVKGDINPGAEVVATGDIIVLGRMRGTAHAGAGGNKEAEVFALLLNPVQIRIGNHFSRSPEGLNERRGPEVARVRGEEIVVEEYKL